MGTVLIVLLIIASYLIGSIPTSVWIGTWFYGIDIRKHGSGNAGATNTIRTLGWKAGISVFIIDVLKGFAAVELAYFSFIQHGTVWFINFQILLGLVALVGHIFPFWAGFKGGKGVAALLGVIITLTTGPALLTFGIFLLVLLLFKYVSIGSIIAGISYPVIVSFLYPSLSDSLKIASIIMAVVLIITHRKNIARLLRGEESKANFLFKKSGK
jgi:acyl phosphate:glycerol-3-phosphate acyltransferase